MIENLYCGYLNLPHRQDRRDHMAEQLNKASINAVRHRGRLPHEFDLNAPKLNIMRNRTPGAIGCMYGQMEIMETALKEGKNAMVLEDDIIICSDFQKRLEYIDNWCEGYWHSNTTSDGYIAQIWGPKKEWDIIWLGASFHVNPPYWHPHGKSGMPPDCSANLGYDVLPTDDPRMIRTFGAYVTFAYIVNVNSIQKILDYLEWFMPQTIGIDYSFIAAAKYRPEFKFFSFVPGCIMQRDNLSDIGTGMTIWSGQLKNGPYVYQDRMEDFKPEEYKWN
jgi:hypothetical protein